MLQSELRSERISRKEQNFEDIVSCLYVFVFFLQLFTFFIGLGLAICNMLVLWLIDAEVMPDDMDHAKANFYNNEPRILLVFVIRTLNALFGVFMALREVTKLSFIKRFRLEDWTVRGIVYIYIGLLTAQRCGGIDVPTKSAAQTGTCDTEFQCVHMFSFCFQSRRSRLFFLLVVFLFPRFLVVCSTLALIFSSLSGA